MCLLLVYLSKLAFFSVAERPGRSMSFLTEETLRFFTPFGIEIAAGSVLLETGFTVRPVFIFLILLAASSTSFFSLKCEEIFTY